MITLKSFLLPAIGLQTLAGAFVLPRDTDSTPNTHCGSDFCTWWHDTAEINTATAVEAGNVRQSHQYLVQVAAAGSTTSYDSFVYESIPRNGNGKIQTPGDTTDTFSGDDGISIEIDAGINMAWSQFEYSEDVDVIISRRDGQDVGMDLIIRPSTIAYELSYADNAVIIRVPADENGRKFSVEFGNDLYTFRSDGEAYTTDGSGEVVGIEPINALLIFASPFLSSDLVPASDGADTVVMTPGAFTANDIGSASIVYFPPGVYYIDSDPLGEAHIKLDPNTYWVYLAPGAYVKGGIEYTTTAQDFYATGHGVLSGEIYVYQANVDQGYTAVKDDVTSLRMWWHRSVTSGQIWHCVGPTLTSPPFNTMDLMDGSSDRDDISVDIYDYKQVGAFFMQTDGPQMYTNGSVHDVFYHVNDDAIKTYYSGVTASRLTVWKAFNDPIIQMGWTPREVSGVTIDTLNIIHSRYRKSENGVPSAIIGASPNYDGSDNVDNSMSISMTISNVYCEGPCPGLFRLTPLQNYKNFSVKGVSFPDGLIGGSVPVGDTIIASTSDTTYNGSTSLSMELDISEWTVQGQAVTGDNADSLGQFSINSAYSGQWSISS
ncbi:CAZyme family GH49 [Penicillium psychrosexuale]|uniref:CAZyme family GH49 n=1 Tax=Penicillium psychrosexuale TaxID=1002107 RepID=UPI0025452CF8|nr:CAZyme family GH49 [Penicillium psychrosexuale]KAJ5799692.1 CAZyme family GH49 [Penicillium psychrosexuale]